MLEEGPEAAFSVNEASRRTLVTEFKVIVAQRKPFAEITEMLKGGLLLDLRAAEALISRGFSKYLGFSIKETIKLPLSL